MQEVLIVVALEELFCEFGGYGEYVILVLDHLEDFVYVVFVDWYVCVKDIVEEFGIVGRLGGWLRSEGVLEGAIILVCFLMFVPKVA